MKATNDTVVDEGFSDGFIYLVHITAVVTDTLSILCSLVIIGSLIAIKRLRLRRLWVMLIGISVGDILYSVHHGTDHFISILDLDHWPKNGPLCEYIAIAFTAGFYYASAWVIAIAINLFMSLYSAYMLYERRREIPIIVFHVFSILVTAVPLIIGVSLRYMGRAGTDHPTWCQFKYQHPNASTGLLVAPTITFIFILFSIYLGLLLFLGSWALFGQQETSKRQSTLIMKKMALFPVVYFLQWFCYLVYLFQNLVEEKSPKWFIWVVVFSTNSGGILNLLAYFVNIFIFRRESPQPPKPKPKPS